MNFAGLTLVKVLRPAPPENLPADVTTPLMTASSLDSPLAPDPLLHTDEEAMVFPLSLVQVSELCSALLLLGAPTA